MWYQEQAIQSKQDAVGVYRKGVASPVLKFCTEMQWVWSVPWFGIFGQFESYVGWFELPWRYFRMDEEPWSGSFLGWLNIGVWVFEYWQLLIGGLGFWAIDTRRYLLMQLSNGKEEVYWLVWKAPLIGIRQAAEAIIGFPKLTLWFLGGEVYIWTFFRAYIVRTKFRFKINFVSFPVTPFYTILHR